MQRILVVTFLLAATAAGQEDVRELAARIRSGPDQGAWEALGRFPDAGAALTVVRDLLADHSGIAPAQKALAMLAARVGDYPLALRARRACVDLSDASGDAQGGWRTRCELVECQARFGARLPAAETLKQAIAWGVEHGIDTGEARDWLVRLGGAKETEPTSLGTIRQRIEEARETGRPQRELGLMLDLALRLYSAGRYGEGLGVYRQMLEPERAQRLVPAHRAIVLNGAARLAVETARGLQGEGQNGLLREASAWAEEALAIHRAAPSAGPEALIRNHCVLGHVHGLLGDTAAALEAQREEYRLVLDERKLLAASGDRALRVFHGDRHHIFEDLAITLAAGGDGVSADPEAALRVSEIGRAGALREMFRLRGLPSPSWLDGEQGFDELVAAVSQARTAVIVFLAGSHEGGAIRIAKDGLSWRPLGPLEPLKAAAADLEQSVGNPGSSRAAVGRAGETAWRKFLAPLLDDLPRDVKRLVFVGLGSWPELPFAAALAPGEGELEERYLAARFELAAAPSLGALRARRPRTPRGLPLAVGCGEPPALPADLAAWFDLERLAPLARAEAEAREVGGLLKGRALTGSAATEGAFRRAAGDAPWIHIAAHAIADDEDEGHSALLLAAGEGEDGVLTLGDLAELGLAARLVVLSTCLAARGGLPGEGAGGLARALLVAGARSVLVSRAEVDDHAAPLLMRHFTRNLAAGSSPAAALAVARRALLKQRATAHPALWAPFLLLGQETVLE